MPFLTAKIKECQNGTCNYVSSPTSSAITWNLEIKSQRPLACVGRTTVLEDSFSKSMSVDILNLDSNFFGMTATGNHIVRGGNATLNVTFNRGNGSVGSNKFKFCIVGENEPVSDVKTTMMPVARQFPNDGWFFGLLPKYESHYLQFNPNGTPNWGGCGVGIGQLDPPPTSDTVWNWKENIEDPWNHLQTDRQPILTRWTTTMNDYNTEKAINPQAVGQPVRDFGSDCPRFFATPFYSSEYNTNNTTSYLMLTG